MTAKRSVVNSTKGQKSIKKVAPKKDRVKKRKERFSSYINKVLKDSGKQGESKGINKKAMNIMNSLVTDIFEQISGVAANLLRYTQKRTLTYKEIEACVKLIFPSDLAHHAIAEGNKAVQKYKNN